MALHRAIVPLIWSGGGSVASMIWARTTSESAGEGGKRSRSASIWEGVGDGEAEVYRLTAPSKPDIELWGEGVWVRPDGPLILSSSGIAIPS